MYYWNTKALAHELAEDTLSKQHYKNYYLAAALVVSAVYCVLLRYVFALF